MTSNWIGREQVLVSTLAERESSHDHDHRRMLTREEIRVFYDRFGTLQDWQGFYEDIAARNLIAHAKFEQAKAVLECGCGTGRFAVALVAHSLAENATYTGCDLSATMVGVARGRLAQFGARAQVELTDGALRLAAPDAAFDRFVANYVLDLLPPEDIAVLLAEAHRVLMANGLLCLVSLTRGVTRISRFVSSASERLHRLRPALVGGCRPIELLEFLAEGQWKVEHQDVVISFGIPSEVLVARKNL